MKRLIVWLFLLGVFISCFVWNSVSAKTIDPSSIPSPIKGKADLTVTNISLDQSGCVTTFSGARFASVNYTIKNIGLYTSSLYIVTLYVDGNFSMGTYDSSPTSKIPAMGSFSGSRLSIFWWGKSEIKVEVTPLNPIPSLLGWSDVITYSNRTLDNNPNNNSIVKTVDVIQCP